MMEANNLKSHVPAPSKLSAREAMKLSRAKRKASLTAEQLKELNKEKSAKKRKQPKKCYAQAD